MRATLPILESAGVMLVLRSAVGKTAEPDVGVGSCQGYSASCFPSRTILSALRRLLRLTWYGPYTLAAWLLPGLLTPPSGSIAVHPTYCGTGLIDKPCGVVMRCGAGGVRRELCGA